eukprot:6181117-Pleurochrysis_carterae.AAC.1
MADTVEAVVEETVPPPPNPEDEAVCGACNTTMLDSKGIPRARRTCAHSCSYCKCPLHAPIALRESLVPSNEFVRK